MKINNIFKLIIAIVISEAAGVVGSLFTTPAIPTWYANLARPELAPPNWIFAPVWTTLFALMGIALFLVWQQHSHILENVRMLRVWKIGIALFFAQLVLNTLWSIIFFGLRSPGWAFIEIIFLWFAILATIIVFAKISKPAAWLLVPYIIWVSFAGYLNFSIWQLNSEKMVACTMEAKLCPDGSYVGRVGPNCEFASCPEGDKTQPIVGGDRDEHGCIGSAGYSWCAPKDKCLRIWEEACYADATEEIKYWLANKYDKQIDEVTVKVTKETDGYMAGSVSFAAIGLPEPGEGGMFLARKVGNMWEVVYDGNGSIDCVALRQDYNFPDEILKPNFCD